MKKINLILRASIVITILFCSCQGLTEEESKKIIGEPIKIGNLLVAQNNFEQMMDWENAKEACNSLGEGWRLPSKDEIHILYENRDSIGGFDNDNDYYWTSTQYSDGIAWVFSDGATNFYAGSNPGYVRAVKDF